MCLCVRVRRNDETKESTETYCKAFEPHAETSAKNKCVGLQFALFGGRIFHFVSIGLHCVVLEVQNETFVLDCTSGTT